jgi:uncharacterized protein (TIGR03435 family)
MDAAGQKPRIGKHASGTLIEYTYMSLAELISEAYDVKYSQVAGLDWIRSMRFDIAARMPGNAAPDESRPMLQDVLEQRFNLVTHREIVQHSVLALTVAKGGLKIKESVGSEGASAASAPGGDDVSYKIDPQSRSMHLSAGKMSMTELANMLTAFSRLGGADGRLIVDKTGLRGKYKLELDIPLDDLRKVAQATRNDIPVDSETSASVAVSDLTGPTLFQSVGALGLRLEQQKAPVEQLVVDHAEKTPSEN